MLSKNYKETRENEITMSYIPTVTAMRALMKFVHSGILDVTPGNIIEILDGAEFLGMKAWVINAFLYILYLRISEETCIKFLRIFSMRDFPFELKPILKTIIFKWASMHIDLFLNAADRDGIFLKFYRYHERFTCEIPVTSERFMNDLRMCMDVQYDVVENYAKQRHLPTGCCVAYGNIQSKCYTRKPSEAYCVKSLQILTGKQRKRLNSSCLSSLLEAIPEAYTLLVVLFPGQR